MRDQHAIRAQMAGAKSLALSKRGRRGSPGSYPLAGMNAHVNGKIVEEEVMYRLREVCISP
jgi:hypothetical protein